MLVSVVIPARDESSGIGRTVSAVLSQELPAGVTLEVIVVDDGSGDDTAAIARRAGATVIGIAGSEGNPGRARNVGAANAAGDPLVFLDADCVPASGWLAHLLAGHAQATIVGGAFEVYPGQRLAARCNHYCGAYHVHARRQAGPVPNHPPANLSVRRPAFFRTAGFAERMPVADGHEELGWQAELRRAGHALRFEPRAVVHHRNRDGWLDLLRRNYRWAYSAIRSKADAGSVRMPWLYRRPALLLVLAPLLALAHAGYTAVCWARAGVLEPVLLLPALLGARLAYAAGLVVGGVRWLAMPTAECRPLGGRWR